MASPAAKKSVGDINGSKKRVEDSLKREKGLSPDVLKDFTESLRDIDRVVVEAIGMRKDKILENKELRNLVYEYFEASRQTLEYLNELENCLRILENSHFQLVLAIKKYEDGKIPACLERLAKFKENGDPFKEKFYPMHEKLRQRQEALLNKAQKMHDEVVEDQKKNTPWTTWTDIFTIVAASATAVAGICVVVSSVFPPAAPVAAVVGVAAIGVAAAAGIGAAVGQAKTDKLKTKEQIAKSILVTTKCVITELDNIKLFVDSLKKQIESLSKNAQDCNEDEDAVELLIDDVKNKAKTFREDISKLTVHTRQCKETVFNGRDKVLGYIRANSVVRSNLRGKLAYVAL